MICLGQKKSLDSIPLGCQIGAEAPGWLIPSLVRKQTVHERQGPERLAAPEPRVGVRHRFPCSRTPETQDCPAWLLLGDEEPGEAPHEIVIGLVACRDSSIRERRDHQAVRTDPEYLSRRGERNPVSMLHQMVEHVFEPDVRSW